MKSDTNFLTFLHKYLSMEDYESVYMKPWQKHLLASVIIIEHLTTIKENFDKYFPLLNTKPFD